MGGGRGSGEAHRLALGLADGLAVLPGDDPAYDDFYFPKHSDTHKRAAFNPPKWWRDQWAARMKDLIDKYDPDHFYFDSAVPFRGDDAGKTGMEVISYLYNNSIKNNDGKQEAVMAIKARPWQGLYADGMATLDYERGKASHILPDAWQTDDSIGSWGYNANKPYTTSDLQIDKFVEYDNVRRSIEFNYFI